MYEFDEDTELVQEGKNGWRCELSPRWTVGTVLSGGYLMAVGQRALAALLPHPDLLTVSGHFIAAAAPGRLVVEGECIRVGNTSATGMVRLLQDGRELARFTATSGTLDTADGGENIHASGIPDEVPPPEECLPSATTEGGAPTIADRFDMRLAPITAGWLRGETGGPMCSGGQIRFADGRPPDIGSLPLFCDAFPPTIFNRLGFVGWVPTLQLTIQYRGRPADGWVCAWATTNHLTNGLNEEDCQLWDSQGTLIALSRQLKRLKLNVGRPRLAGP